MKGVTAPAAFTWTLLFWELAQAQPEGRSIRAPAAPEKIVAEASLTATLQQAAGGADVHRRQRRATYRGDITAMVPAPAPRGARGSMFGHVRLGRGAGLASGPSHTGSLNSVAFEQAGGSSFAILAQMFYQFDGQLATGDGETAGRIVFAAGKIDPFAFFDQNEVADDETRGFLNNVFVHNPLLDSGGDIGADRYGFAPGVRAAWFSDGRHTFGTSFGIFGVGRGARFSSSPGRPLVIAQVEVAPAPGFGQATGNYRFYAWTNPQATGLDGTPAKHAGWGTSIDQRIGQDVTVFGRLGRRTRGRGAFDRAVTFGAELLGTAWGRPRDAAGLAVARLSGNGARVSRDGDLQPSLSAPPVGTSGGERILEVFYRHALAEGIEISPGFQVVSRAGGDPDAPTTRVFGVRVKLTF